MTDKPETYNKWVEELGKEGVVVGSVKESFDPAKAHVEKEVFPCNSCGACCRNVKSAVRQAMDVLGENPENPSHKEIVDFPYQWDSTGRCEMLGADNKCTVYENRPPLCSIDEMHKRLVPLMDKKEFYNHNIKGCNTMMDIHKLPLCLRLKLLK